MFLFSQFYDLKNLAKFSKNLAKLVQFTLTKINQNFCNGLFWRALNQSSVYFQVQT